ncbi:hypothetical protein PBAL39_04558 [Pedobacter sp. BAL39]|uniref:hypothetical protein n=1 Tax=Pedobacter sp. BAL39 TaxID=391596 RepID=UPI0001559EF5|nr:hypothetical protein [Pedobacter sp. BAL39]EDM37040.1 hypothetical protein PBAL39_04558 [Pedobacter sp. BAL39]
MRLFRSKKQSISPSADTLRGKLASYILRQQSRIAGWLNERTSSYSPFRWMVLLILFCLGVGGICIYLIIISI